MRLARWAGPALLVLGLAAIIAVFLQLPRERSPFGWWIISNAQAYERVLPLVGLGSVLALVGPLECVAAFVLFTAGIALGFFYAHPFMATLSLIPGAEDHQFFAEPILCLAIGFSLPIPGTIRRWSRQCDGRCRRPMG